MYETIPLTNQTAPNIIPTALIQLPLAGQCCVVITSHRIPNGGQQLVKFLVVAARNLGSNLARIHDCAKSFLGIKQMNK